MPGAFARRFGVKERLAQRFLVIAMIAGFVILAGAAVATAWLAARTADHTYWVAHTYRVEVAINRFQTILEQTETTRRGYILTGAPQYLESERRSAVQVEPAIERLNTLIADNPRQTRRVIAIRTLLAEIRARQDSSIALVRAGRRGDANAAFGAETDARRMIRIRAMLATMSAEEQALLRQRDAAQAAAFRTFWIVLAATAVLILALAIVSLATVLRYTRELHAARQRLEALNAGLEAAVVERTADLTRANEEIQRFAYIVSHDLRSPLVNVMGFTAELEGANAALDDLVARAEREAPAILTEDAVLAAREDLPEAIGFIRSSTQKMDRLINAILKLSRQGRRTLVPEPLSLDDIASGIRASLQHIVADRGAAIVIETPLPTLVSDRLAVEQILSNLIENAVKYLSPDRPGRIVVRGHAEGDRRVIAVSDNGRGIAAADHERIFDLFRRSGTQDQPGEGIGLAHVRALVYRLGGTIAVASTLGEGSVFTVTLPASLADTGTTA